jgi:hypothetical protein
MVRRDTSEGGHTLPSVASERFRRTIRGYDPGQVKAALAARDARVARLEREAKELAERVRDHEERLGRAIGDGGDGGFGEASPGAIGALGRRLEEIHAQARRQATRIRMKALQDAVQMSDRVLELTRLRDELGTRVQELAGVAGLKAGERRGPARGEGSAGPRGSVYSGEVEIEVGPLPDFAALTGFEDAAAAIEGVSQIAIRRFSGGRATVALELERPVELVRELQARAPYPLIARDTAPGRLVLDVAAPARHRRAA